MTGRYIIERRLDNLKIYYRSLEYSYASIEIRRQLLVQIQELEKVLASDIYKNSSPDRCKECERSTGIPGRVVFPWLHCLVNKCKRKSP